MKIIITGRPGAGKSTFSRALAAQTGLPLHHTDKHFFKPGWQDNPGFRTWLEKVVLEKEWIIDGISSRHYEPRLQHADYLIIFRLPYWRCLWRIIKRRFSSEPRPDRPAGCYDNLEWKFIKYLFRFEHRCRERLDPLLKKYPQVKVIEVRSDAEAAAVFKMLSAQAHRQTPAQ